MSFAPDSPLVSAVHPAANREPRRGAGQPSILLLHYTGMRDAARAVHWLAVAESRVSCHYVVDDDGRITQLVPEAERAWHAGLSCWQGCRDINSASIGIEIHNPGHDMGYPDFAPHQIDAVIALGRDICARHAIPSARVLAHSDVAPGRKIDPGEKFPWHQLAASGLGAWVQPAPLDSAEPAPAPDPAAIIEAQTLLARYGYAIEPSGLDDARMRAVVRAFQQHFRPARSDGHLDRSTLDTLARLAARFAPPLVA